MFFRSVVLCVAVALVAGCGESAEPDELGEVEQEVATPCTVSITSAPTSATLGDTLSLAATASCPSGTADVQWFHRVGTTAFAIVQPFGPSTTLSFDTTGGTPGDHQFYASVKRHGVSESAAASATVHVAVADTVGSCSSPSVVSPTAATVGRVGEPVPLFATADCGGFPNTFETQFWVRPATTSTFTVLPDYVPEGSQGSFIPTSEGKWVVVAAVRMVGAHVPFQVKSSAVTFSVVAAGVNRPPLVAPTALSTIENHVTAASLNEVDPDGDPMTVLWTSGPLHGTFVPFNPPFSSAFQYLPALGFVGTDSISFKVSDDHGNAVTGKVTITVTPPTTTCNVALTPATSTVPLGSSVVLTASTDCAVPHLQYYSRVGTTGPFVLEQLVAGSALEVSPTALGTTQYVAVAQGKNNSEGQSIPVTVTAVDNAPPCTVAAVTSPTAAFKGKVGEALTLSATASCGGAAPEFQFWVRPSTTPAFTVLPDYTPDSEGFTPPTPGTWVVQAVARAQGAHVPFSVKSPTVSFTVVDANVNRAPVAHAGALTVRKNDAGALDLTTLAFDPDGDPLSFSVGAAHHGTVGTNDDDTAVTYTPALDYTGTDTFVVTIRDNNGGSATSTVTVTIPAPAGTCTVTLDAPPTATFGSPYTSTASGSCSDGQATEYQWYFRAGTSGAFSVVRPWANAPGADQVFGVVGPVQLFALARTAGSQGRSATVTVTVADNVPACTKVVLTAPTATQTLIAGHPIALTAVATCPAGVVPDYQFKVKPPGATAFTTLGHVLGPDTFTPASAGSMQIIATARNSAAHVASQVSSSTATRTVTVNHGPVAADDAATSPGTAITIPVTANDSDADGDALVVATVIQPVHGTATAAGASVSYTPTAGFSGDDTFQYTATDGVAASNLATVTVHVTAAVCGDGVVQSGEECDDGNASGGDGCEADCTFTCAHGAGADRVTVDRRTGSCYAGFDSRSTSFQEAARFCRSLGGHLPNIADEAENDVVVAAAGSTSPWIGIDDLAIDGVFTSTDGQPQTFFHWKEGEPNNAGGHEQCLMILSPTQPSPGFWNDAPCDPTPPLTSGTVCEIELFQRPPVAAVDASVNFPESLATGDVDGDGIPDVAVGTDDGFQLYLGDGVGAFTFVGAHAHGDTSKLAIADLDGDGHADIVTMTPNDVAAHLWLGQPGVFFLPPQQVGAATIHDIAVAKLDGVQTLITAGVSLDLTALEPGIGLATRSVSTPFEARSVVAFDLDGDGHTDLAIGDGGSQIALLRNSGDGTFTVGQTLSAIDSRHLVTGDFNGDGQPDLASWDTGRVSFYLNISGTIVTHTIFVAAGIADFIDPSATAAVGDLDGDGIDDLALPNRASSYFVVRGDGTGAFPTVDRYALSGGASSGGVNLAAIDADGDGHPDLVSLTQNPSQLVTAFRGVGPRSLSVLNPNAVMAGDFTGDGFDDVWTASDHPPSLMFVANGNGAFHTAPGVINISKHCQTAIDLDADGKQDLVTCAGSNVAVLRGTASGLGATQLHPTAEFVSDLVLADLDRDGFPDAIAFEQDQVEVMLGTADGSFGDPVPYVLNANVSDEGSFGDFDGDGNLDAVVSTDAGLVVLLGDGAGQLLVQGPLGPVDSFLPVAGDLDGDGISDLLVEEDGGYVVRIADGHGGFTDGVPVDIGFPDAPAQLVDLDGDGRLDIVVTGNENDAGYWNTFALNQGGGVFAAPVLFPGNDARVFVIDDIDGNSRPDLVTTSPDGVVVNHHR